MGAISQDGLVKAVLAVKAMDVNQRLALADEVFVHQPNLLASVLVQQRMGASLQQIDVLLNILFVAYQAMKTSARRWPVISQAAQDRCLQRLTGKVRFAEGLGIEMLERAVQDQIDAHGEPQLLAFAFAQLREHDLLGIETEVQKYLVLGALNLVECVAATAPSPSRRQAAARRPGTRPK